MASINTFPPDVPKKLGEASDDVETATGGLRARAADMAERASETVKDGFHRAKDALAETDPVEVARESGEAVARAAQRHPLAASVLGALGVGLIAWAGLRAVSPPPSYWRRYRPDYHKWRNLLSDYGHEAAQTGERALHAGGRWLHARGGDIGDDVAGYAEQARGHADLGGRMLMRRAEREPIAALLGLGLAVYVIGSLLTSASEPAPARKRTNRR